MRSDIIKHQESGGVLAELALSIALLITLVGGAIDITMQAARYGELVEVAKTVTRMAADLTADASQTDSIETAAEEAIANVQTYLSNKGFNPAEFDIQFLVSSEQLQNVTTLRGIPNSTAFVTVAIKRKGELTMLPTEYLFDSCVKSTYIWENAQNVTGSYVHNADVDLGCV